MTWRTGVRPRRATLRGAEYSDIGRGGDGARQVGGKRVAIPGATQNGVPLERADPATAQVMRDLGGCETAHPPHPGRVRVPKATPMAKTQSRIDSAHDSIRGTLPRKVQSALSERSA